MRKEIRPHLRAARDLPEIEDLMRAPDLLPGIEVKFPIEDSNSHNQEQNKPNPIIIGETTTATRRHELIPLEIIDD